MKFLCLLFLGAAAVFAQPISVGIKAGVPLTDFVDTVQSKNFGFNSSTKRYIVGGTVELRLPMSFSIEGDALYRRLNYNGGGSLVDVITNNQTTGNAWEFPILLKYRFGPKLVKPFVDAGVAFDTLTGLKQTVTNLVVPSKLTTTTTTSTPAELKHTTTTGFVIGAGLDIHPILIHVTPEIRFTRWGSQHFTDINGLLKSSQNQAEFLIGFTF